MSLLSLPNDLIFKITKDFPARHLNALIQTNRHLKLLLNPYIIKLAIRPENLICVLCWAAINRVESMITYILENGPPIALMKPVSDGNSLGWEEVYRMPMKNARDALEFIYTSTPNIYIKDLEYPDTIDKNPDSGLYWAMRLGDMALVKLLLKSGAEFTEDCTGWRRAMIIAAKDQDLELVGSVLERERDFDQKTQALQPAVFGGHEDLARKLLENGADVMINYCWRDGKSRYTLLGHLVKGHCQARWSVPWTEKSERMLRLLLAYGADPTIPDENQKTALSHAMEYEHQGILSVLSDPYPWNGVEPRLRGELKVVDAKKEKRFFEEWAIWRLVCQARRKAARGYKRAGQSLTLCFGKEKETRKLRYDICDTR